jgi:uncharacterized membrane protein YozB (DUF420 family)
MSAVSTAVSRRQSRTLIAAVLGALALIALWFIAKNAWRYTDYSLATYQDYWPRRGGLIPHIIGGVVAITTGVIQLWLGLTGRISAWHRALGKVYASGVLVGSAAGYYMALTIPSKFLVYSTGLFGLCTAWVVTTAMAIVSIRRRQIEQHRDWMLRSYTVTFAFVFFRLVDQSLNSWHVAPADDIDAIVAWACWSVPLLIAEPLIQLRKFRRA